MNSINLKFYLNIIVILNLYHINAYRVYYKNSVEYIMALDGELVTIECKRDISMAYCSLLHPSGKRYSFSGPNLSAGQCNIQINATKNDQGKWKCHIGQKTIGVELSQDIELRIVNKVAAVNPNVTATHGKEITLECITTRGMMPISYCRFEPPKGNPFSINEGVKQHNNSILGRFFYPQNKSLDRGDCAVTIRKVKYEDLGVWTCGVGLDDVQEHTDDINLIVEGLYTMTTASATGITFGAIGIVVFLGILGVAAWKKRRYLGASRQEQESIEIQEIGLRPGDSRSQEGGSSVPSVVVQSPSQESEVE